MIEPPCKLSDHIFKTITLPTLDFAQDYSQVHQLITTLTDKVKSARESNDIKASIFTCSNREPLGDPTSACAFIPVYVADLKTTATTYQYTVSKCFSTVDFGFGPVDDKTSNVHVYLS
jgi:hypothetical protein